MIAKDHLPQSPGIPIAYMVDPPLNRGIEIGKGDFSIHICVQIRLEPFAKGDHVSLFELAMGR